MHKLMEYVCDELETLEKKAEKGNLSMAEVEYADKLTGLKKNILKIDEMTGEDEFSMAGNMSYRPYRDGMHGGSYARRGNRGGNRGANQYGSYNMRSYDMGYSRGNENMIEELRDMMQDAPDEKTRVEFEKLIRKMEQM